MRPSQDELKNVLTAILPEYKRISQWSPHDAKGQLYKSIDSDGNVFLIVHPSSWDYDPETGQHLGTFKRPQPRKMLTWAQAKKAASGVSTESYDGPRLLRF